jgi:putative sporulation protein YtxC
LKSIYFRSDKELIYFCEVIFQLYQEVNVQWRKNKHWGNELRFKEDKLSLDQMMKAFVHVFVFFRLDKIIQQIAKNDYYYSDDAEIERIGQLTKWVMTEKVIESKLFNEGGNLEAFIFTLFEEHLEEREVIHFDGLMTFCIKPLFHKLKIAVGFGIDEMKREEEHQSFIQSIREYIKLRPPKTKTLYIVEGQTFHFYKENGDPYTELELKWLMRHEPLYMIGLDDSELNIAPVITLLPEKIYLFGHYPTEAKTNTLLNLFQERVQFRPLSQFPFSTPVK